MVNLLFISSSTKIDTIRNTLQLFLNVKIDIVADFDYGLKDVFEKRPATVFIHDQIGGVTGESVARHIQMLLGSGAPSFIFMHEGNIKAKPIKGLFEYLIDLSQGDEKIVADIQTTLKSLLGPEWEKIYTPPQMDEVTAHEVSTRQDQQSDLPKQPKTAEPTAVPVSAQPQPAPKDFVPAASAPVTLIRDCGAIPPASQSASENPPFQGSPTDYIRGKRPAEDVVSKEHIHVFEEHSGGWTRYVRLAVVLTMCAVGGVWYLLKQKPYLVDVFKPSAKKPVVMAPATRPVEPTNQPVSPPPQKTEVSALPSFIPFSGLDSSFPSLKPGWERYVDATMEFRVYRLAGKIKALQVLGVKNHDISEPKLKSILIELLGDGEYLVEAREQKFGYYVSRAQVGRKADLLIYRKKTKIRAFVVSID